MVIENNIALAVLLFSTWLGYRFYPASPGKIANLAALILGPICTLISLFMVFWLLTDPGGGQGSVGAWILIFSVATLGVFAVILLSIFAGAGCFLARLRK